MRAPNSLPFAVVTVPSLPTERLQFALEAQVTDSVICQLAGRPAAEVDRALSAIARHEGMRATAKRAVFEAAAEKGRAYQLWLNQRCLLEQCLDEVDRDWEDRWCEETTLDRVPPEKLVSVARAVLEPLEATGGSIDAIVQRELAWDALEHLVKLRREVDAATDRVQALMRVYFARKDALRALLDSIEPPPLPPIEKRLSLAA
jgi:hypothetical protein